MKKTRTYFEPLCMTVSKKRSPLQLMGAYFQLNNLTVSKEQLRRIMSYAVHRNTKMNEDPLIIFQFHQWTQTLVQACYLIMLKERKWIVHTELENISPLHLGLLSEQEYQNPLLVFKKAFREYSVKEFDYFLSGMAYFSLGNYDNLPERNIISPYIHLIKMLDAAYLILERKRKK